LNPLDEVIVTELRPGPLYWRIETFAALAQAQALRVPLSLISRGARYGALRLNRPPQFCLEDWSAG
jgi:hypothetical protein